MTRAGIWREVLEFVRLPLPLLIGRRGGFFYRHSARLVRTCRPGGLARSPLRSHSAAEQEDLGISICGLARPEEAAFCCGASASVVDDSKRPLTLARDFRD